EQTESREEALGPAALIAQLACYLLPAVAGLADEARGRHEHLVEHDFVEMPRAGQVLDRPDVEPGRFEIDEELRQALVAVLVVDRAGAAQRDHEMRLVRAAGPD